MTFVATDLSLQKNEVHQLELLTPRQLSSFSQFEKWINESKEMEHYVFPKESYDSFRRIPPTPPYDSSLSYSELRYIVQPNNMNCFQITNLNTLFTLVEQACRNSCVKISSIFQKIYFIELRCLLKCVRSFDFHMPVKSNDLIIIKTQVTRGFNSSMEVAVEVDKIPPDNSELNVVANGFLTYVCVDFEGIFNIKYRKTKTML